MTQIEAPQMAQMKHLTDAKGRPWDGRCVTVIGLGKSGQAAAELLCQAGARVMVTEAQRNPSLQRAAERLRACGVEEIELGQHTRRVIERSELVVVSPGVSESCDPIQWAISAGLPIISEIELAFRFCQASVIAVTGTNGKSSVTTLIHQVLVSSGRSAIACGNLGVPFAAMVSQLPPGAVAVVEVSSFQLARCDTFRPAIGALLNLGTNHLDRHPTRSEYLAAKARLFQCQTPDDWAVLNGRDPDVVRLSASIHARQVWFADNRTNPDAFRVSAQTVASLSENAQAVLQVGRILDIPDPLIWQTIRTFRGLEHRLEHVATVRGVSFINDSKSTTPESLLFALREVRGGLVLILGGRDKALNFDLLTDVAHDPRIKGVVLIGEARTRLRALLNGTPHVRERDTLESAIHEAAGMAHSGETVLFSPACASFDMFRNFEERGRTFKGIVRSLVG
jgi:UDP-N-acetylmuramoylalanine--D-glutamate ligase